MIKKIFSHTAIYGLAPQVPKLAGLFTLPIITKYLTEIDFGIYGLITALMGVFSMLAMLGMGVILSNTFYKSPMQYKWAWRQIYGFLILWTIPYALFVGFILYLLIPLEAKENAIWIILLNVIPLVFFGPTNILGTYFFQFSQKPMQVGLRSMIVGLLTVFMNLLFIAYYKMGYMGWFLSLSVSQFFLQSSYWIPINLDYKLTPIFNFKRRFIKDKLKVALPTVPHSLGGYLLNSSGKILMGILGVSTAGLGFYNTAAAMGNYADQIGIAAGQATSPIMLQYYKKKEESEVRRLTFILQTLFLGGFFMLSIWMKEIFKILIQNEKLQQVYPLAIVLVMAYTFKPMYLGANNRLFFFEKTNVLLKITFVAGIASILLNLLLIPIGGYQVVAYVVYVGCMYIGYVGYYLKEFRESCEENYYPLRWLLLTLLLSFGAYFLVEIDWVYKIIISVISFILTLFVVTKIIRNE